MKPAGPLALLLSIVAPAQVANSPLAVTVIVRGTSGVPVANARMLFLQEATGQEFESLTNSKGRASLTIPDGQYRAMVSCGQLGSSVRHIRIGAENGRILRLVYGSAAANSHEGSAFSCSGDMNEGVGILPAPPSSVGPSARLVQTRSVLIGATPEPVGFGLYSYLLFAAEPSSPTRPRYEAALNSFFRLFQRSDDMLPYRDCKYLGVVLLPLTKPLPEADRDSAHFLSVYNYARAEAILSSLPGGPYTSGPYLVSAFHPIHEPVTSQYLFQDLSSVPPTLISAWLTYFVTQTSKPNFWEPLIIPNILLRARTDIQVAAQAIPDLTNSAQDVKKLFASIIWSPVNGSGKP